MVVVVGAVITVGAVVDIGAVEPYRSGERMGRVMLVRSFL